MAVLQLDCAQVAPSSNSARRGRSESAENLASPFATVNRLPKLEPRNTSNTRRAGMSVDARPGLVPFLPTAPNAEVCSIPCFRCVPWFFIPEVGFDPTAPSRFKTSMVVGLSMFCRAAILGRAKALSAPAASGSRDGFVEVDAPVVESVAVGGGGGVGVAQASARAQLGSAEAAARHGEGRVGVAQAAAGAGGRF